MKTRLKTDRQLKIEERNKRVVAMFEDLKDVEGSDWQKCILIAKKYRVTADHICKIIKKDRNETRATNA